MTIFKLPLFRKHNNENETADENKKEYSIFSNMLYVIKGMYKYNRIVILFMVLAAATSASMEFIWPITGKLIIDGIQKFTSFYDLLWLSLTVFAIQLSLMVGNVTFNACTWWRYIYIRFKFIENRIKKAMTMSYQYFENPKVLDYNQKAMDATSGNDTGVEGLMHNIQFMLTSVFQFSITLSIMFTLSPIIVVIIIILAVTNYFCYDHARIKDQKMVWDVLPPVWRKQNYLENIIKDFSYAKDIRLFSMKSWLMNKLTDVYSERNKIQEKSSDFWFTAGVQYDLIGLAQQGIVFVWLIWKFFNNGLSIGDFTLYFGSTAVFFNSIRDFLNVFISIKANSYKINDFRTFMEYSDIDKMNSYTDKKPVPKLDQYDFVFENVSFKYPNQDTYALKNLNLTIKNGERLAIVGLNGAGKTTLVKLLTRLYDVSEGRLLLNGVDVREYERDSYYKVFSPVFQDINLFAASIAENVSMETAQDTDNKSIEEYLKLTGLYDKVKMLEKGINTELLKILYDDGIDLSGGEKQKLALTRAVYKNAPVVVLDEPTSALDALAEYKLYIDFDKLIGNKTAVYISHRLSSTRFCNSIAMFAHGEMVEYGTHETLIAKGGEYAEMFRVQAQYYLDETENYSDEEEALLAE